MGLDLYHVSPTKKSEETIDYFTLDEFDDNLDFIQKYSYLIEELEHYDYEIEILVFPNLAIKELITKTHENLKDIPFLIGELYNLTDDINILAVKYNVDKSKSLVIKQIDNLLAKVEKKEIYYHSISFASAFPIKTKCIFYETNGFQRKGMNERFYKDFENCKNYFDIKTVQKASLYLEPSRGESMEELEMSFKESFIDNFIEGKSIFFASW